MNYYQHHIGDFNNATRYLTLVERALYRDLIEMYYDSEKAIDASDFERLARRLLCRTDEEKTALRFVLSEFFELVDNTYVQSRCEREIAEYHAKKEQQSKAGRASAEKRSNRKAPSVNSPNKENNTPVQEESNECSTDVEQPLNDPSTNHKPLTNNQEPIINTHTNTCEDFWKPDREFLLTVIRTSVGEQAESVLELPDYEFQLGNFNAHWENKTTLTENQKTRKFATWLIQEFNKQKIPKPAKRSKSPLKSVSRNVNDAWGEIPKQKPVSDDYDPNEPPPGVSQQDWDENWV
ncbi:MAG: YdaU family protein [Acinetobacter sp.]|uniref:YdaU family protein n=1 Tax=Acinetobacter sp. TaxID=472 RepID=UPI0026E0C510|nr:YdaU family protein [Acinetobacter sp.]MDO5541742.1 YdaU family protein [Acinetobacter sp.]